ncbi:MAG TPA: choice-of-anchor Q domain-containing protein [Solirubrobacterales bacterium]|nr:choice-of-anchor Q domain-containing protein [Solirubrobacterales bacterium]
MNKVRAALAVLAAATGFLVFASPASATTWCVPDFFAGCPDNGSNQVSLAGSPSDRLEAAMNDFLTGVDLTPDTILLAPGTISDPVTITASGVGTDDLLIQGAGRESTTLTSGNTGNNYLINLNGSSREITFKDLAILVPENFPNTNAPGSAVQSNGDNFESVDLVTENVAGAPPNNYSSGGFENIINGGTFRDVRVFGRNGATFSRAFNSFTCGSAGQTVLENVSITSSREAVDSSCVSVPVSMDRVSISGAAFPVQASNGADLNAANLLIESDAAPPVDIYANSNNGLTDVRINHATIVATGDPAQPAIRATVPNVATAVDSINVLVENSIITGFSNSWNYTAPVSPTRGNVDLAVRYSNVELTGAGGGDVTADTATGNIAGAPGFAGITDYKLAAESSAVDAGDPAATLPAFDLAGAARPVDGNRDGTTVRDMGAFEFVPESLPCSGWCPGRPTCEEDPAVCPAPEDTVAPTVSKLKFRYRAGKGGVLRFRVSEAVTAKVVLRPKRKPGRKTVRFTRMTSRAKSVKIKLGKRRLKPGRYTIRILATDKAGHKSKPLTKTVKAR